MTKLIPFLFFAAACGSNPGDDDVTSPDAGSDASTDGSAPADSLAADAAPDAPAGFYLTATLTVTPQPGTNYATLGVVYHCPDGADPAIEHATTLSVMVSPDDGQVRSRDTTYTCGGGFDSTSWFDLPCGSTAIGHVIASDPDGATISADTAATAVGCGQ